MQNMSFHLQLWEIEIADHFTYTSANVIYCITYILL